MAARRHFPLHDAGRAGRHNLGRDDPTRKVEPKLRRCAFIPLHQQAPAWGVSKKLKVVQRADNQVLPYWMVKQEE
jgi:hypothetical protein